jgi:hypothetical protein
MAKSVIQTKSKPDFGSILDKPAQDAQRPPTLPRGYYRFVVQTYRFDKSSVQQTEFVEFGLKVIEPYEAENRPSVDEDELEEFGDVRGSLIGHRLYVTEKAAYRIREFLEHCGVDLSDGKSMRQGIPEAVNCEVIGQVIHEPLQSGDGVMARIRNTAPVEE